MGNVIKIEIDVNVNDVSLVPVVEMVVNDEGGDATHPFQTDRYNGKRVGADFWPDFSERREATKKIWLDQK